MGAPILTQGAVVNCAHAAPAQPASPYPRVLLAGQAVTTLATPWTISGCPFAPGAPSPCVTGQWLSGAVRVLAGGQPVAVTSGASACVPNGTPLTPVSAQTRVTAT
ncbi:hypothetical protein [Streptomyces sp. NPDC001652]|uniref:hypothetical protein n=1 Tax=Streptomyces sp. NPDC001652 TaxID=3154393 RepID=UPI0033216967